VIAVPTHASESSGVEPGVGEQHRCPYLDHTL
jgi:hypothetical protein